MLNMFIAYSTPVERVGNRSSAHVKFLLVFNANKVLLDDVEEFRIHETEVERAERKKSIYDEITDRQIREVIQTTLLLCNTRQTAHESDALSKMSGPS